MNRGIWHQCGFNSQKIVDELLTHGVGTGVVLSTRDLNLTQSASYANDYRLKGAQILIDQQFYVPGFNNTQLSSYPISQHRASITQMNHIGDAELASLATDLREINQAVGADAIIAPAVIYEASRQDIVDLNARLFAAAKQVGNQMNVPTYATVVLGRSVAASNAALDEVLSQVTGLDSDGWYYSCEFEEERVPSAIDAVFKCGSAGLTLACTGKPVLHAYASPMALLSFGFGATGAAIGHFQTTWHFNRDRWAVADGSGGGGGAPPRFFCSPLWGTLVCPDETSTIGATLRATMMLPSPFSASVTAGGQGSKWASHKHLLYRIGTDATGVSNHTTARLCANAAITRLDAAVANFQSIAQGGLIALKDQTNAYQHNWAVAMQNLLTARESDYDFLELF